MSAQYVITVRGVRKLAELRGFDPTDAAREWLKTQHVAPVPAAPPPPPPRVSLRVVSGETMLKPDDAPNLCYTTQEGAPRDRIPA